MLGISITNARVGGFRGGISAEAKTIYNRIIADGGVSNLSRLNFFVKGLKAIYGDLANVPVCYDAHWIGYKLGSGTGATAGQAAAKLYSIKNTENLLTFSEQFDNAVWAKTGVTITANSVNSPTGTLTADLVTPTISDAKFTQGFIPTSAIQHNFSIYLRSSTGSSFSTVLRITRDSPFSNVANTVITVTTEWQRFDLTFTTLDTTTHQATIGGASTLSTGENLYAWGAQLNTGSVALPYTQTTTTAETLADAVQATAASQPLLLAHNGASSDNYYYAVPTTGNYCLSSLSYNTSDWDVEFKINGKYTSVQDRVVSTRIGGNGTTVTVNATSINLEYSIATVFYFATALVTNTNDVDYTIRVTRNSTTGAVTFIRNGVTLTTTGVQLLGTLDGVSNLIEINGSLAGVQAINAKIYYCNLYIAGNIVRNFNPATYNAATSQTAWTSSTGEVWTINTGTATTGYKGVLVDRTIVQGDGIDDVISVAISGNAIRTQYFAHKSLGASTSQVGGLYLSAGLSQAFYYNVNKYSFYQSGAFDGPFGALVAGTTNRALRISGAVGGTGTDWIPFQNGVDVSNGGANIGLSVSYNILTLFSRGNITNFDNAIMNTYIQSSTADNLTIRTATQAFAKTLNNNI